MAAQNAACVLDTTGMPQRSSSGLATPSVRKLCRRKSGLPQHPGPFATACSLS
jgi:hypothetical protein